MLYELLYPLREHIFFFNVFRYITFRAAYAAVTAFLLTMVLAPWVIAKLRERGVVKHIRQEGPDSHQSKKGTPTMGGLLILAAILIPTLLWADLGSREVLVAMLATAWLGGIGFLDDYLQVIRGQPKGLVGRAKITGQVALGVLVGIAVMTLLDRPIMPTATTIPFFKEQFFDLGWLYVPFIILVITGSSNAVNLTDGLDGLAIGIVAFAAVAFAGRTTATRRRSSWGIRGRWRSGERSRSSRS
jgi:phospho-N-acetylmuramoyl-pentapeptide-transferase